MDFSVAWLEFCFIEKAVRMAGRRWGSCALIGRDGAARNNPRSDGPARLGCVNWGCGSLKVTSLFNKRIGPQALTLRSVAGRVWAAREQAAQGDAADTAPFDAIDTQCSPDGERLRFCVTSQRGGGSLAPIR